MKYLEIKIDNKNIKVSKIALGSARSIQSLSREECFRIFDIYYDLGGNCIDTARAYNDGKSEALIGEYFSQRHNREKFIISTKGCHMAKDGKGRLSKADMESDLNESLKALQTDFIDIYWIHKDDENHPVEDVIDDMNALIKEGRIGVVGVSNWRIDRIAKANEYAKQSGQIGFQLSQIQWSLASTLEEYFKKYTAVVMDSQSYDWYINNDFTIFSFGSQAQGFFAKAAAQGVEVLNDEMKLFYANKDNLRRLGLVKKLAEQQNMPISAPVLAYLINNKLSCVPIIGASSEKMLRESMSALDFEMTSAEADALFYV